MANTTTTLQIETNNDTLNRILAAYNADATVNRAEQNLNDWLLGIVLDWVEEVEKPAPARSGLGFGN